MGRRQIMGALDPKPISRDEAAKLGLKRFFTGVACKHGHLSERYTTTGGCVDCVRRVVLFQPEASHWRPLIHLPRPLTDGERPALETLLQGWVKHVLTEWDKAALLAKVTAEHQARVAAGLEPSEDIA